MGNYVTSLASPPSDTSGKVILWDGSVQEFSWPLTAAEMMLEHPQQVVVEFREAVNQKRPVPLPADYKLDVRKVYVMVPIKRGKPTTLSSEEARRVLLSANTVLRSKSLSPSSSKYLPLFARICPANDIQDMGLKIPLQMKGNGGEKPEEVRCLTEFFPETMEGRPEYLRKQISGKGWKPSLDTIKEKLVERKVKVPHWLY